MRTSAGLDDQVLGEVLDDLAARMGEHAITWSLGGSASRRVRGGLRAPRDVDVLVDEDVADELVTAFGRLEPPDHLAPDNWRSAWLLVWRHPRGVDVEFIGGAAVLVDDDLVRLPGTPATYVRWQGRTVPISEPVVWDRLVPGGSASPGGVTSGD